MWAGAAAGCGADESAAARSIDPATVARKWAQALRRGDLKAACRITVITKEPCLHLLRALRDPPLTFRGPAVNGGGTAKGDAYFSFNSSRKTVFVTILGSPPTRRVRVEAIFLKPSSSAG